MPTFRASPNGSWVSAVALPFLSPSLWFEFTLLSPWSRLCFFFSWRLRLCFAPNCFPHFAHVSLAWQVLCLSSLGWFGKLIGFLEHFPAMQIYCPFPVWRCICNVFQQLQAKFDLSMPLKMHVILHHYMEFFESFGETLLNYSDEVIEAMHSQIRLFEEAHRYLNNKKGSTSHAKMQHKTTVHLNSINFGDR